MNNTSSDIPDAVRPLGTRFAGLLVFVASAAVLLIELVALRLLAPVLTDEFAPVDQLLTTDRG